MIFENCKQSLSKFHTSVLEYAEKVKVLKVLSRIAMVHTTNGNLQNEDLDFHIELIKESIKKMEEIFAAHLKSDSARVITNSEYNFILSKTESILGHLKIIESSTKILDLSEMESHKKKIINLKRLLEKIFQDLSNSQLQIDNLQTAIVSDVSKKIQEGIKLE